MTAKPVVAVAMSGGVDSSVAAALLVGQGYQVLGLMLKLWSEQGDAKANRCCTPDSVALARRVASNLSIPFYVLDARQLFYDSVVAPFINDYANNLTPNPCIQCNRILRWDFLLNHALVAGADFLATGHYARIIPQDEGTNALARGIDSAKDQSYVLHVLNQANLKHALFPLGEYTKPQVRLLASKYNLPVAERPDSQDLCFVGGDGDYRQFISRRAPQVNNPGNIVDQQGNVLGQHPGLAYFTIGQRKGLHISSPEPLYVAQKDTFRNALVVKAAHELGRDELIAEHVNWIAGKPPKGAFSAQVKIRYKSQDASAMVTPMDNSSVRIKFEHPLRDITPGQAAVIYNGDICLGGGIISARLFS